MTIPAVEKKKLEHIKKLIDGALEGKTIQREFDDVWCDYALDSFLDEFDTCEMRIKPEPKAVQFTMNDYKMFYGKNVKYTDHAEVIIYGHVDGFAPHDILIHTEGGHFKFSYEVAFEEVSFRDGSIFGKEIIED